MCDGSRGKEKGRKRETVRIVVSGSKFLKSLQIRLFPINSLGFREFMKQAPNSRYLLETQIAELLDTVFHNNRFQNT